MASTILKTVNGAGIPCIETTGVTLTSTNVIFSFNSHPFIRSNFSGLIVVKISNAFTAPETPVPIQFVTTGIPGTIQNVLSSNYTQLTTANWPGEGIYLFFYDREDDKLIMMTGTTI